MQGVFVDHVLELLAPLGRVTARGMFGGHGIYLDGLMFAIVLDDTLYLKADEMNVREFQARRLEPFTYARRGRMTSLNYYRAPEEALDAPHQMAPWARTAFSAALRAKRVRSQPSSRRRATRK
jgi:DNA transformation protein